MKTKHFKTYKEACAWCNVADVSNECVQYNPGTNQYLIEVPQHGNLSDDLRVARAAWKTLQHSSEAADRQEAAWLARIISQYERDMTDENARYIIEAGNRHRWRMAA